MKGVDTIARVRREFYVRGLSIKEICRELHVSRNTVRKILRSVETAFVYERSVQPQPKIGPWKDELDRLLATNAARSSRERLTLIRVFEELRGLGYGTLQRFFVRRRITRSRLAKIRRATDAVAIEDLGRSSRARRASSHQA
jgi:transcriptional regulator with XRE-family HTH domain